MKTTVMSTDENTRITFIKTNYSKKLKRKKQLANTNINIYFNKNVKNINQFLIAYKSI